MTSVRPVYDEERATVNLGPCPDCNAIISRRAESCPHCGRFMQNLRSPIVFVDKKGWSSTIGWGIIMASILLSVLSLGLLFVFAVVLKQGLRP